MIWNHCDWLRRVQMNPPSAKLEPLTEVHLMHTLQTTVAIDLFYNYTASGSLKLMSTGHKGTTNGIK